MRIIFDAIKRDLTLADRGLDFADAAEVFAGPRFEFEDTRFAYPERRFSTIGTLAERMVVVIWCETDDGQRVISMRKANDREQTKFGSRLA